MTSGVNEGGETIDYTLLAATSGPLSVSLEALERKLAQRPVAADLSPWGLDSPVGVLESFVCAEDALRKWVGPGPVNTDDLPITQYLTSMSRSGPIFRLPALLDCLQSIEPYLTPTGSPEQRERLRAELDRHLEATRLLFNDNLAAAHKLMPNDPKLAISWRNYNAGAAYWAALGRFDASVPWALAWVAAKAQRLPGGTAVAVALTRQALAVDPNCADARRRLGLILASGHNPSAAIPDLTAALKAYPDEPDLHNAMGGALASIGKAAEAEAAYREAIRLSPDTPWAYLNLAGLMASRRRLTEAADLCRQALAIAPDNADVHTAMGTVLMMQGQRKEAADEFTAALRIDPNNEMAKRGLAEAQRP